MENVANGSSTSEVKSDSEPSWRVQSRFFFFLPRNSIWNYIAIGAFAFCDADYESGMWKRGSPLVITYISLFIASAYVNKYVLSVLKFQYPTIFQGWQTLVGAVVMRVLYRTGQIDISTSEYTRVSLLPWLPGMMLFVTSIYSGSKALSVLPIPSFMCLHNLTSFVVTTGHMAIKRKITDGGNYVMMMVLMVSAIMVAWTDPQYSGHAYSWMMLHILTSGFYNVYAMVAKGTRLTDLDKLFCSYVYSVIVLAPSSYFLGDALAAVRFPFLYFYRFYIGCVISGVFGVFFNLCGSRLRESSFYSHYSVEQLTGIAKFIAAMCSFSFFEIQLTAVNSFWMLVNLLAGILLTDTNNAVETVNKSEDIEEMEENIT